MPVQMAGGGTTPPFCGDFRLDSGCRAAPVGGQDKELIVPGRRTLVVAERALGEVYGGGERCGPSDERGVVKGRASPYL